MPDSGTVIVFRILGVLASARSGGRALVLEDIANALSLARPRVEQYLGMLQRAGAVRAEAGRSAYATYSLTRYGLDRLPRYRAGASPDAASSLSPSTRRTAT